MSFLSGKCDLLDHISGLGGYYDKDGNRITFIEEYCGPLYSDIYQDFLVFKKQTGGVLHQYKRIKEVTPNNHHFIESKLPEFKVITHKTKVQDRRTKSGFNERITYGYEYFGKEYTAQELKDKGGVSIIVDIHFDTLLELAMYFPYTVSVTSSADDKKYVVISEESYVERHYDELIQHGYEVSREHYNKLLVEYIKDLSFKYFDPRGKENVEIITFEEQDGKYIGKTSKPIDPDFEVKWNDKSQVHFSSPSIEDADKGLISIHENDFCNGFGDKAEIYYVEKTDKTLYLR